MKLVSTLQSQLEKLYELQRICDVKDFVTSDEALVNAMRPSQASRNTNEQLLIQQDSDTLFLSLYLNETLLARLRYFDPADQLSPENLDEFLVVLEGVSHFVYITWNANYRYPVSLFELELQAEIDKFVLALMYLQSSMRRWSYDALVDQLFVKVRFDSSLSCAERLRYQAANRYAAHFCRYLKSFFYTSFEFAYLNELRRFYRLNHWAKLKFIRANEYS